MYFYATGDAALAESILDALRRKACLPAGGAFGSGHALLEYGKCPTDLDGTDRVLVVRSFEDFAEQGTPAWALSIAAEAARIEQVLRPTDSPVATQEIQKAEAISPKEEAALASYQWALTEFPELADSGKRNYDKVYAKLKAAIDEGRCPQYSSMEELPGLDTWSRYVREGLRRGQARDGDQRGGRAHGSSVADQKEL